LSRMMRGRRGVRVIAIRGREYMRASVVGYMGFLQPSKIHLEIHA
jgi:hypothetical protein